jgi:hypothetical protein
MYVYVWGSHKRVYLTDDFECTLTFGFRVLISENRYYCPHGHNILCSLNTVFLYKNLTIFTYILFLVYVNALKLGLFLIDKT